MTDDRRESPASTESSVGSLHPNPLPAIPGEGTPQGEGTRRPYGFSKDQRLRGRGTFKKILDNGRRKWLGPIGLCAVPCDHPRPRLGISIGRPVGNAVRRNAIKRKLREAFRHMQHDWPSPHDVVILVKKHDPMTLAEYQRTLSHLMVRCCQKPAAPPSDATPPPHASSPAVRSPSDAAP